MTPAKPFASSPTRLGWMKAPRRAKGRRRFLIGLAVISAVSCSGDPGRSGTTAHPEPATEEQLAVFCDVYDENLNESRQDLMAALSEVAPAEIEGPIKRAAELNSSFDDDAAIAEFLKRCD